MTRPDYIRRGGDIVFAPPLALQRATMYSFLVDADLATLTGLIDAHLNAVSAAHGTIYKPLLPMAAFVCADMTRSFSTTAPDSDKGWLGERDFGVWIPVAAGAMHGETWKPARIAWYLPYVFVDNVAAMVTGREVFGFFKQTAQLIVPPEPSAPGRFALDALVIPTFAPASQADVLRLLTITSSNAAVAPEPTGEPWTGVRATRAVFDEIKRLFFDRGPVPAISAWGLLTGLLDELLTGDIPLVFLKQFRDARDPSKACYQAVVEAVAHLDHLHGFGFTHPHDIELAPYASHPIASDCGLGAQRLRAELGFWCSMDFTMRPGEVIAEAT